MPELPEVETVVQALKPITTGKIISVINLLSPTVIAGDQERFREVVEGLKVERLFRRGKYICFSDARETIFTLHLRMTGKLVLNPDAADQKYIRARIQFTDGSQIFFVDMRRFGRLKLWEAGQSFLPQLGPEPLDSNAIWRVLDKTKSSRAIKTFLLDQKNLAGVGNIYADETLFRSGIHPLEAASKLSRGRMKRLSRHLPEILKEAIKNRGTTISDYKTPDSANGGHQTSLKVYGRTGQPCYRCGNLIEKMKINGRGSHFCPVCQK